MIDVKSTNIIKSDLVLPLSRGAGLVAPSSSRSATGMERVRIGIHAQRELSATSEPRVAGLASASWTATLVKKKTRDEFNVTKYMHVPSYRFPNPRDA